MKQKELANLSLEELWQLFPVILTPHQQGNIIRTKLLPMI